MILYMTRFIYCANNFLCQEILKWFQFKYFFGYFGCMISEYWIHNLIFFKRDFYGFLFIGFLKNNCLKNINFIQFGSVDFLFQFKLIREFKDAIRKQLKRKKRRKWWKSRWKKKWIRPLYRKIFYRRYKSVYLNINVCKKRSREIGGWFRLYKKKFFGKWIIRKWRPKRSRRNRRSTWNQRLTKRNIKHILRRFRYWCYLNKKKSKFNVRTKIGTIRSWYPSKLYMALGKYKKFKFFNKTSNICNLRILAEIWQCKLTSTFIHNTNRFILKSRFRNYLKNPYILDKEYFSFNHYKQLARPFYNVNSQITIIKD